mmetsp:Transcript_25987/g.66894  ORF Transcript_25987/g.66894 Transcript_25987/m.66894 type:complete len:230 (+) Transcript_25987:25-714(+)
MAKWAGGSMTGGAGLHARPVIGFEQPRNWGGTALERTLLKSSSSPTLKGATVVEPVEQPRKCHWTCPICRTDNLAKDGDCTFLYCPTRLIPRRVPDKFQGLAYLSKTDDRVMHCVACHKKYRLNEHDKFSYHWYQSTAKQNMKSISPLRSCRSDPGLTAICGTNSRVSSVFFCRSTGKMVVVRGNPGQLDANDGSQSQKNLNNSRAQLALEAFQRIKAEADAFRQSLET